MDDARGQGVQHAAVESHPKRLPGDHGHGLKAEAKGEVHRGTHLRAQIGGAHEIDESARIGAGEDDASFPQGPAYDLGVVVLGAHEGAGAVIEIDQGVGPGRSAPQPRVGPVVRAGRRAGRVARRRRPAPQDIGRDIGSLQMAPPGWMGKLVNGPVHGLQDGDLFVREVAPGDGDEIAVAGLVGVADGEGPLEVEAHEVIGQALADPLEEGVQDMVELDIGGGAPHGGAGMA